MPTRRALGAVVAAGLGLATLTGCGATSASSNPTGTVNSALQSDLNQPGLRLDVRLQATTADLSGSSLTTAQKQDILDSHLVVTVHSAGGTSLSQASATNGNNAFELQIVKGSDNLVDLRYIGDVLYARVDITKFASDYNLSATSASQLQGYLQQLSAELTAARALAENKWVSLNIPAVESVIANQLHVSSVLLPHLNPGELIQVVDSLFSSLEHNSTATAASGSGDYQLTVHEKGFAAAVSQALASAPGVSLIPNVNSMRQSANSIPANATVKVQATVSSGRVTRLVLPASQFGKGSKGEVVMGITSAGAISAPAGAVAVNPSQLSALISALGKSTLGG